MADGRGEPPIKKKLLGWVQGALGKLEQALDEKPAAADPAPRPASGTGALERQAPAGAAGRPNTGSLGRTLPPSGTGGLPKPGAPGSGPLGRPAPLPGARAPQTGRLGTGTDSLTRSAPPPASASGPLPPPPPPKDPAVAEAESKERMGFIIAYMQNPTSDPVFSDKQFVYKILTEERSYQQNQIVRLSEALHALPPDSPEAIPLEEQIASARTRQGQLFTLLKRLTGVRGKTGGTGFLAKTAADTPPDPIVQEAPSAPDAT